jgi:hypothetical protein
VIVKKTPQKHIHDKNNDACEVLIFNLMQIICKLLDKQLQHKELANKKHQQYSHSTYNKKIILY